MVTLTETTFPEKWPLAVSADGTSSPLGQGLLGGPTSSEQSLAMMLVMCYCRARRGRKGETMHKRFCPLHLLAPEACSMRTFFCQMTPFRCGCFTVRHASCMDMDNIRA